MNAPEWTGPYEDRAIVLRTYSLGEADRIVVMLGEGHGRIRGVAKGARRPRSRFASLVESGNRLKVRLWRGRSELDTLTSAESLDVGKATLERLRLRENLAQVSRAMAMLEATERVALDRTSTPALYDLLLRGLSSLTTHPSPHSVGAFLWRLAQVEGIVSEAGCCALCGERRRLVALDVNAGGLTCEECRSGTPVRTQTAEMVEDVLSGRTLAVLARKWGESGAEFERTAVSLLERHTERRLRVPAFIGSVAASDASLRSDVPTRDRRDP